jgi:hypothetical protein
MGIEPWWDTNWERLNRAFEEGPAMIAVSIVLLVFSGIALYTARLHAVWYGPCAALGVFILFYRLYRHWHKAPAKLSLSDVTTRQQGVRILLSEGELVKATNADAVYIIHNGKRLHFSDGEKGWKHVAIIDPSKGLNSVSFLQPHLLDQIPLGPTIATDDDVYREFGIRK